MIETRARSLLDRIAAVDGEMHAFVAVDRARVLAEARVLDAVPEAERGALHGTIVAIKDLIDVAGMPTRAGSAFFRRDPTSDAPVVERLRDAGALIIGKTNTHEFAWGITTENQHFGRTQNPHDPARIAGGSSGGSGAAVGAGFADFALGTDTLGSIRIPSAVCGIVGVRPPTGTFSLDGIVPLALGLDTVGPLARDMATLRAVYAVLGGTAETASAAPRVCRLHGGAWDRVTEPVRAQLDALADRLRNAGVPVTDVPWWDESLVAATAVVQQYAAASFHRPLFAAHADDYGTDVRLRVERSLTVTGEQEAEARAIIAVSLASFRVATRGFTCALAPVVGEEAPLAPAPLAFREATMPLVTPASAFGLGALAVPLGVGPHGMPLGLQVLALDGDIAAMFALGARIEAFARP